ncbi:MAG: hypothetical protein L6R36_007801 [Xanthoria steineri]|nr:MAG: hypothetical protein L6R36_007801 [Xanthoria steineri]
MKALAAQILGLIVATGAAVLAPRAANCGAKSFDLTVENWKRWNVDKSIRAFWKGGVDAEDVEWPGADSYRQPKEFTNLLGSKLQNKGGWTCSGVPFDASCDAEGCEEIGRRDKGGNMVSPPSHWGVLALHSVINLHVWMVKIYDGINDGQVGASSAAFNIATDFVKPKDNPNVGFQDVFAGAAALFGLLGALPAASWSPYVAGANAVAGLIGTEIGLHVKDPIAEPNFQTAAAFSSAIQLFAEQTRTSIQEANKRILNSDDDTTLDIISGGQWVNAPTFTQDNVTEFYKRNMIARGINAVWRQYPVYVYYVWLDEAGARPGEPNTKCDRDRSGPQALKYCADDGVYYLYMYNGRGIDWPWGGPKLADKPYFINPIWAIESSARSFKASGGINYDPSKTDASRFLGAANIADYIASPDRLEGTWTLPVCDGSSRGRYNVDYINAKKSDLKDGIGSPPCACGIDGRDTATFVRAANLDPEDMAKMCLNEWAKAGTSDWPPGADRIAYGEEGKHYITRKAIDKCREKLARDTALGSRRPSCELLN